MVVTAIVIIIIIIMTILITIIIIIIIILMTTTIIIACNFPSRVRCHRQHHHGHCRHRHHHDGTHLQSPSYQDHGPCSLWHISHPQSQALLSVFPWHAHAPGEV